MSINTFKKSISTQSDVFEFNENLIGIRQKIQVFKVIKNDWMLEGIVEFSYVLRLKYCMSITIKL